MKHLTPTDVSYATENCGLIADTINGKTVTFVVSGGAASAVVPLNGKASAILSAVAYVKTTGAPAAKALLVATTDYTLDPSGGIKFVTDQSLNYVLVNYTL